MAENTAIEWCDRTWSPWEGCTKVSLAASGGGGCDNCYAAARNTWLHRGANWGAGAPRRLTADWTKPMLWNRQAAKAGKRISVFPSICDPFDNEVDPAWRTRFYELVNSTPYLTWLLLTKRVGNVKVMAWQGPFTTLPNVWLGATVVNQDEADRDMQKLLAVPARVHFVSYEPALGPIDARRWLGPQCDNGSVPGPGGVGGVMCTRCGGTGGCRGLSWVIAGGESGPHARPAHPDWFRRLRDDCDAAGVPFMFKQWGEWWEVDSDGRDEDTGDHRIIEVPGMEADEWFDPKTDRLVAPDGRVFTSLGDLPEGVRCRHMTRLGKKAAGRLLDGVEHNGFPEVR